MIDFLTLEPTDENYWRSLILFGKNVACYKFALGKALLEIAPEGKSVITLEELGVGNLSLNINQHFEKLEVKVMQEYRCTRNRSYAHECIGQNDLTARQGYYIHANSSEEALQRMAQKFPEDLLRDCPLEKIFTIQEWEGFNVVIEEVKTDRNKEFN